MADERLEQEPTNEGRDDDRGEGAHDRDEQRHDRDCETRGAKDEG